MCDNNQDNRAKSCFVGDWVLLKKKSKSGNVGFDRVKISAVVEGDENHQMKTEYTIKTGSNTDAIKMNFDEVSFAFWYEDSEDGHKTEISFWRNAAFDMIFSCQEDAEGNVHGIWAAKRESITGPKTFGPVDIDHAVFQQITSKYYYIHLSGGAHAAKGAIKFRQLLGGGFPLFDDNNELVGDSETVVVDEGLVAIDKNSNTGLVGLFHVEFCSPEDVCCDESVLCEKSSEIYDILTYDKRDRSFNSVFGVRSVNWQQGRVFATFNNKSSIPATNLPSKDGSTLNNNLGSLMCFEQGSVDTVDDDDPDIGIWVGDPNPPG